MQPSVVNGTAETKMVRGSHLVNDELSNGTSNRDVPYSPTRSNGIMIGQEFTYENGPAQPLVLEDERYGRFTLDYRYFDMIASFLQQHTDVVWFLVGNTETVKSTAASLEYPGTVYLYGEQEFGRQIEGLGAIVERACPRR